MNVGLLTRPEARTHPRVAARRDAVQQDRGRRRRRWAIAVLAVVSLLVAVLAIVRSPLFDVDRVIVVGAARTGSAAVRDATDVDLGTPMISVDVDAVARDVERLPWIGEASVTRDWPGTVRIEVTERRAVARADDMLVDGEGRVLGSATAGDDLPLVQEGDKEAVAVLAAMPASLRRQVARSTGDADHDVDLRLYDNVTVHLGDQTDLRAKFDAVEALLAQADRSTVATIDVTVPSAATLTRTEQGDA